MTKRKQKFTYLELINTEVINPAFEPSTKDYARAIMFSRDVFEGKRDYVVTSKPYRWALTLQRLIEGEPIAKEVLDEVEKLRRRKK